MPDADVNKVAGDIFISLEYLTPTISFYSLKGNVWG